MKITFMLLDAFTIDGTVRSTLTLADELARAHEVEIVSVLRDADAPVFPLSDRVRLRALSDGRPGARVRWPQSARARRLMDEPSRLVHPEERCYEYFSAWTDERLTGALRRLRSDVLVTTRAGLNLLAARLAPAGTLRIAQEHLQLGMHRPGILAEITEWYPRLDALTTLTVAEREDYERLLPGGSPPVFTIGNGLPERLYPRSRQQNRVVAAAGRIVWLKGYDLLIDAWAQVVEKHPDWRLRIYGNGPRREEFRRRATRLGLYNHVLLMDATGDVEGELAKASILALPSRAEAFGMTIIEAFACGVPVVGFDCPRGPREIIAEGRDGLLVPPEDSGALAASLIRLIDDGELRRRLAAGALASSERYRVGRVAAQWDQMLSTLAPPPP